MKFELDNFTPPSFTVVKSVLLSPTKFFKLAVGGVALKCKRYKNFCAKKNCFCGREEKK